MVIVMKVSYEEYVKEYTAGKIVCVCPMGVGGITLADEMIKRGIEVNYFCDSFKKGTEHSGIPCISFEELEVLEKNEREIVIVLETTKYYKELKEKLISFGCNDILRLHYFRFFTDSYVDGIEGGGGVEERVSDLCMILADETSKRIVRHICQAWQMTSIPEDYFKKIASPISDIYFDRDINLPIFEKEISFVDCGAYIGDTVIEALKKEYVRFRKIFMFELDRSIYEKCIKNVKDLIAKEIDVKLYPYGVSDSHKVIEISMGNGNSKLIETNGDKTAEVVALDDVLLGEDVDYIKMDIEGEELKALKGAERILKTKRPALAICLYHKPEDMFEIPRYIKSVDSSYEIYIRHYSDMMFDTVCYAI